MLQHPAADSSPTDPARVVVRILQVFSGGSSSPALVETGSGELFVLKLAGSGAGPLGLLTECLGSRMAQALGVPVPLANPLFLPPDFPWQVGTDEFDDLVKRSRGWNLGVSFIPDSRPFGSAELPSLPRDFLLRLACADRLLQNVDRGSANPNLLAGPDQVWAIDFGSCLFLNRILAGRKTFGFRLPAGHFLARSAVATAPCIDPAAPSPAEAMLPDLLRNCPDAWLQGLPLDREGLGLQLGAYIEAFLEQGRQELWNDNG